MVASTCVHYVSTWQDKSVDVSKHFYWYVSTYSCDRVDLPILFVPLVSTSKRYSWLCWHILKYASIWLMTCRPVWRSVSTCPDISIYMSRDIHVPMLTHPDTFFHWCQPMIGSTRLCRCILKCASTCSCWSVPLCWCMISYVSTCFVLRRHICDIGSTFKHEFISLRFILTLIQI